MSDGLICLSPQTPSAWADECGQKKRGCHKRSASCSSTDQLREVRTRLGSDLLSSPTLCSIQWEQGRSLSFISPLWDWRRSHGMLGGEAVSLSYYWQALVNQKYAGVTTHYTLPSSSVCVCVSLPGNIFSTFINCCLVSISTISCFSSLVSLFIFIRDQDGLVVHCYIFPVLF